MANTLTQETRYNQAGYSAVYNTQHAKRFKTTIAEINRLFKGAANRSTIRILDIGSLTGAMCIALKREGYDVYGVDFDEVVAEYRDVYVKNGIDIRAISDPTQLPYEDNYFDCVVFTEVLEHVYDTPLHILNEFKRALKVGGCLLITTPNVMRLENKLKFLLNINIYQDLHRYVTNPRPSLHFREYTMRELVHLLEEYVGMDVVRTTRFDNAGGRTRFRRIVQRTIYTINYVIPGLKGILLAIANKRQS